MEVTWYLDAQISKFVLVVSCGVASSVLSTKPTLLKVSNTLLTCYMQCTNMYYIVLGYFQAVLLADDDQAHRVTIWAHPAMAGMGIMQGNALDVGDGYEG